MTTATRKYTIDDILAKLQGVKKNGSGWMAFCPAHDDGYSHGYKEGQSLSVSEKDGKVLMKCFAGCQTADILHKLYVSQDEINHGSAQVRKAKHKSEGKIIQTYDYTDMHNDLLYQVVKYEPKGFKQRRPDGKGGWIYKLDGINTVPYHLYELWEGVATNKTIYIAEGEKDVDNLRGLDWLQPVILWALVNGRMNILNIWKMRPK
ncbi:MAG: hypothetical protein ACJ3UO_00435 [Dehalococcoides mccartyi]|uniref:hypothetical protein n=1 Tax=Dehalococcoides mccartyi TaxID=61435 RepID=UPI003B830BB5